MTSKKKKILKSNFFNVFKGVDTAEVKNRQNMKINIHLSGQQNVQNDITYLVRYIFTYTTNVHSRLYIHTR